MTTKFKFYVKSIYVFIRKIILFIMEIKLNQDFSNAQKQKINLNTIHNREFDLITKTRAHDYKSTSRINQRSEFSFEEIIKEIQRIVVLHDDLQNN